MRKARRRLSGYASTALLALAAVPATGCPIGNADLTQPLLAIEGATGIVTTRRQDADSKEPIRRDTLELAGGAMIVVEQQNCEIHNLRVTLLGKGKEPSQADLQRFGAVLTATPVWAGHFAATDAAAFAREHLTAAALLPLLGPDRANPAVLDKVLHASDGNSEVLATLIADTADTRPFGHVLTLYIGVGGL